MFNQLVIASAIALTSIPVLAASYIHARSPDRAIADSLFHCATNKGKSEVDKLAALERKMPKYENLFLQSREAMAALKLAPLVSTLPRAKFEREHACEMATMFAPEITEFLGWPKLDTSSPPVFSGNIDQRIANNVMMCAKTKGGNEDLKLNALSDIAPEKYEKLFSEAKLAVAYSDYNPTSPLVQFWKEHACRVVANFDPAITTLMGWPE